MALSLGIASSTGKNYHRISNRKLDTVSKWIRMQTKRRSGKHYSFLLAFGNLARYPWLRKMHSRCKTQHKLYYAADEFGNSVEKCLKMCGLEPFSEAMVGTLGVEQKKRTTIGVELAAKVRFSEL